MADYPSSVKTFTTKVTGDTVEAAHVNDLQGEVTAVENALLNGIAHIVKPSSTDSYNLGTSSSLRWLEIFAFYCQAVGLRLREYPAGVEGNNYVEVTINEALAANRTLGVALGDANRTLTISGNATINQNTATTGSPVFAQLAVGTSAVISTQSLSVVAGTFTGVTNAVGLSVAPTLTVPANGVGALIQTIGTLVEAGSGTHALLAGIRALAPTITGAAGAVTDVATVYIDQAPSATVTGAAYAFWVDAGVARFDGQFQFRGLIAATLTSGANENFSPSGLSDANTIDATANADSTSALNGLVAQPDGTTITIRNVSAFPITINPEAAGSTAANRFLGGAAAPVINAGRGLIVQYCASVSRWIIVTPA